MSTGKTLSILIGVLIWLIMPSVESLKDVVKRELLEGYDKKVRSEKLASIGH